MRVLIISHSCVIDLNQHLYQELASLPDVEVMLIAPSHWKSEFTQKPFKTTVLDGLTVPFYRQPVAFAGKVSLHFYLKLPLKQIRAFRPDVIFLHQEPWSLVMFQMLMLNLWLRCRLVFLTAQNLYKAYPPPFSLINWLTFQVARKAVVLSAEGEQLLRRKGYKKKIALLPHTINDHLFYPQDRPVPLKKELGLDNTFVIGYIGRLVEEKGIQILLKAAARLAQESDLPGWKVLIVGSGNYQSELESLVKQLKLGERVIFAGTAPHHRMPDYLNCMDVFVLPSLTTPRWKEQFGRVLIEALACNVPVIGSDSGEIPNLVKATGGGLVSPEGQEQPLSEALKTMLTNPQEHDQFAERGREAVKATYTDLALAKRLAELFK